MTHPRSKIYYLFCKLHEKQYILILLLVLQTSLPLMAQNDSLKTLLNQYAESSLPALHKTVSVSVSNISLRELVRLVARETGVNIYLPQELGPQISNNFSDAQVKDIIYYLCQEYNLKVDVVGNIVRLVQQPQPTLLEPQPQIDYNQLTGTITYNLQGIQLERVAEEVTQLTGVNITPAPPLRTQACSGYGKDLSIEDALSQLGFGNNFTVRKINATQFVLLPLGNQNPGAETSSAVDYNNLASVRYTLELNDKGRVNQSFSNANFEDVFRGIVSAYGLSCKLIDPLIGTVDIEFKNSDLSDCLYRLFKGTGFTYRMEGNVCMAGKRDNGALKDCKVVELYYRSAEALNKSLPPSYLAGVEWADHIDNNSIILFGDADRLHEFENFIRSIDKKVPLVLIDVIIAEVSKNMNLEMMLTAGIGKTSKPTTGTISPGIDMSFNSTSINNALDKVGLSRIGQVTPNFYAQIKALEENGTLNVRSTPRLSALNGKEATLSIGKTEYYREETNSYMGQLDPILNVQRIYKPVTAELSIKIRPVVSGDGSVTLSVEVTQSDFTARIDTYSPPGIQSRKFKSEIHVQNNEMVLLGGLEENTAQQSSSGLPFISRIPILKWFFGSSKRKKTDYQFTIFIRPTIIN